MKPVFPPVLGVTWVWSMLIILLKGEGQKFPSWCQYSASLMSGLMDPSLFMFPTLTIEGWVESRLLNPKALGRITGSPMVLVRATRFSGVKLCSLTQIVPFYQRGRRT